MEGIPLNQKLEAGIMREPTFGPIHLDLASQTVQFDEAKKQEKLSGQEYQVLWLLVRAQGAILTQSEIEDFLHADHPESKDMSLDGSLVWVVINGLRGKLEKLTGGSVVIETHVRFGYSLAIRDHSSLTDTENPAPTGNSRRYYKRYTA